ncbi:MAG TPA: ankyrin repeat domain-containing protein [Terracidiphilus sp.]
MVAANDGQTEVAELLFAGGADVNAKDRLGRPPLRYAESNSLKSVADLLRKHGAK